MNFYVGYGDGGLEHVFWRSLIGLLYISPAGNEADFANMRQLAAHWRSLGRYVPMFSVTAEPTNTEQIRYWHQAVSVDLEAPPYNLKLVEP